MVRCQATRTDIARPPPEGQGHHPNLLSRAVDDDAIIRILGAAPVRIGNAAADQPADALGLLRMRDDGEAIGKLPNITIRSRRLIR